MAKITTLPEMKGYIKKMLGDPVIVVEIAEQQLEQIIEDTIAEFSRYNYGEGLYRDHIIFNLSAGVNEYSLSDYPNVEDVFDFQLTCGTDGINNLFTPTHVLLYNDMIKGFSNLDLIGWDVAMNILQEIKNRFTVQYKVDYNPNRGVLTVLPTPKENYTGVIAVYKKEAAENLYNHLMIKKLAVAKAKQLWGLHLTKYAITLPGGGTINGADIIAQGKEEEEKVSADIRLMSEPIDFFIG